MYYYNKSSDANRESTGILATLRDSSDGKVELIFDDASSVPMLDAVSWSQKHLFTIKEFELDRLEKMDFTQSELVEIAESLLTRLKTLRR